MGNNVLRGMIGTFGGMRVIESVNAVQAKQVRFPKSKKKRIRKKWAKQRKNFTYTPGFWLMGDDTVIAHPSIVYKLRSEIKIGGV